MPAPLSDRVRANALSTAVALDQLCADIGKALDEDGDKYQVRNKAMGTTLLKELPSFWHHLQIPAFKT